MYREVRKKVQVVYCERYCRHGSRRNYSLNANSSHQPTQDKQPKEGISYSKLLTWSLVSHDAQSSLLRAICTDDHCFSCLVAVVVRIYYNVVISMIDLSVTSYQEYLAIREQSYLWARIEANVSIVAACLPTLGPLIGKWAGIKSPFASTMNENKIENDFPSPVIIPSTF